MKTTAMNAGKPRNFNVRYVSLFIYLFWLGAGAFVWAGSWAYDSYETSQIEERLRPASILPVIVKDVLEFKTKYNRLPDDLDEFVVLQKKWTLNRKKQSRVFRFSARPSHNKSPATDTPPVSADAAGITAVRFRNYTYLYARINADTGVLWALPEPFIPEGYQESAGAEKAAMATGFADNFRRTSSSHFLVINKNEVRQFSGATLKPLTLDEAAKLIQPTPAELFELGMLEKKTISQSSPK